MKNSSISYKRHRFPQQIIAHAVWLYFRFPLSLRLLLERGIIVSYETIRRWGRKFGPAYAKQLRRRRLRARTSGTSMRLWFPSPAESTGFGVPSIKTATFSMKSFKAGGTPGLARRLLRRLLRKQGMPPKGIITDKLRSYSAAKRDLMPTVEHRSHKGLNNRAENSHLPRRKREHQMQGFRSAGGLQRFITTFSAIRNLFVAPHRSRSALATHIHRVRAMAHWKIVTGAIA
jgi:putative transposase